MHQQVMHAMGKRALPSNELEATSNRLVVPLAPISNFSSNSALSEESGGGGASSEHYNKVKMLNNYKRAQFRKRRKVITILDAVDSEEVSPSLLPNEQEPSGA